MHLSKLQTKKIFWWIKLFFAVVFLYMWLVYKTLPVGEKISDFVNKDYLDWDLEVRSVVDSWQQEIQGYIDEWIAELVEELTWHYASQTQDFYQDKFDKICNSNQDICSKITWMGDFTIKEKYIYLSSVFKITNFVIKNNLIGNDLKIFLNNITINNSVWDRRWYATSDTIVFNLGSVESRNEFVDLTTHEMWHIVDLGSIQWSSIQKHWSFTEFGRKVFSIDDLSLDYYSISWKSEKVRKPSSNKKDFCSWYGMTNPFEDFAECMNMYINHNAFFKKIANNNSVLKEKYNFIANLYGWNYLADKNTDLDFLKNDMSWRPWDTTRLKI